MQIRQTDTTIFLEMDFILHDGGPRNFNPLILQTCGETPDATLEVNGL